MPMIQYQITPPKGLIKIDFREIWRFRELIYIFVWRNIKVRYKQTTIGIAWAVFQPLLSMIIFSVLFGRLVKVPSEGVPYPIFVYAGLLFWNYFSTSLTAASGCMIANENIIKKVYFPRLAIPIANVLSGIVDFVIAFVTLIGMMLYFGIVPTINILWLPLFLLLSFVTSLGVSLWLSALNVQFRDVQYVMPFLTQFWLFATPIAYPSSLLSEPWRTLYGINPMVGVVEGFRWALLGTKTAPGPIIIVSALAALAILVSGAFYFRRMEKTFADVV